MFNFKEMNLELDDLDESILYQDKLMSKHLELLKQGKVGNYGYQSQMDAIITVIKNNYEEVGISDHAPIPVYFVDNYHYFDRPGIYCYGDDADRFVFFDKAQSQHLF